MWRRVGTGPTFRRIVNTKLRGVTSQETTILIPSWACRVCIQRHHYVRQLAPRVTYTFSHDGRQHIYSPVFQFAMSRDPRVHCIAVNIKLLRAGGENVSLRLADEWSIEETYCSLHAGLSLVEASRRQINSDSCQKE